MNINRSKKYETRQEYRSVVTVGSLHNNILHFGILKLPKARTPFGSKGARKLSSL